MFCEKCGEKISKEEKFCSSCGVEITESVSRENNPVDSVVKVKSQTTIKCGNCEYVGPGEPARNPAFTFLAWLCVLFAPLITIIYFVATHKYRCPKCRSTFLGVQNSKGVFAGQRGGTSHVVWIVVWLFVGIAIIGILSSVVLASLNSARKKARDARRVADIKQIQLAEELYFDANKEYSAALADLAPTYISVLPIDPLTAAYTYEKCSATLYHVGAALEESTNPALTGDLDAKPSACINVWGVDTAVCSGTAGTNQGSYCYDVGEGFGTDNSIDSSSQTYYYYTNSLANVRTCPSFSCDAVVQYEQNTKFDFPYSPNNMPEWIKIKWQSDQGNTGVGYMNRSVFSSNPTY